jgi:uncharacterized protein with PhoU and TrkA domain
VEMGEEIHPVLAYAFGESDEIIVRVPVAPGSPLDGKTLAEANLELETGFYLLAVRRGGRYLYRPRGRVRLEGGDALIAAGPAEGYARLAELCGFRLVDDEETGETELVPVGATASPAS